VRVAGEPVSVGLLDAFPLNEVRILDVRGWSIGISSCP